MFGRLRVNVEGDEEETDLTRDEPGDDEETEHQVRDELRELEVLHHLGGREDDVSEIHQDEDNGSEGGRERRRG